MKIILVKAFSKLTSVGLLAHQLRARGHEVHVLVPKEHPDCDLMRSAGITMHVFDFVFAHPSRIKRALGRLRGLCRMISLFRAHRYDVIHLNLWRSRLYGRIASLFVGKRIVVSSIRGLEALYEKRWNRLDDATVAVSATVKRFLVEGGLPEGKIRTIHNGVDIEAMDAVPPDPYYLHRELGLDKSVRLIGMVAFFRSYVSKGHKFFFDAAPIVAREFKDVAFVLVGGNLYRSGYNQQYCEASATANGIRDRVHFLGERADIPAIMGSLYANVLPSLREGCPMVILEAMARATPNVASRIDSILEIIEDRKNGLLFEPGNPAALAESLRWLLENPEAAKELGLAGRKRVEEAFGAVEMGRRYERLYLDLCLSKFPVCVGGPLDSQKETNGLASGS